MSYKNKFDRLAYERRYYAERRQLAISYLGGCCVWCGAVDNLEFDHINPEHKLFTISSYVTHKWEKLKPELDKCQLLCHQHHLEKTRIYGDNPGAWYRKYNWDHGTETGYRNGCRCDKCRSAYSIKRKEHYIRTGK